MALIGGARLTNESAYAWAKLAKSVIGTDSVDAQLGDGLPAELVLGLPRATIDAACAAPVVITLAGDLREELPVLFLRLREAVIGSTELIELTPVPTGLSPLATATLAVRPGEAPLVARALCGDAAATTALAAHPQGPAIAADVLAAARASVAARADGEGIVIVLGRPVLRRVRARSWPRRRAPWPGALPKATFLPALRRGNVFGALDMGLAPGLLPGPGQPGAGRDWFTAGLGLGAARRRPRYGRPSCPPWPASRDEDQAVTALVLLGSDPMSDFPDRAVAEAALSAGHFVVAVTGHPSESVDAYADVVLPCAVAHERPGTTTNIEGRVSRLGPQADRARLRLGRLDDRGRAGRRARVRPGGEQRQRPGRRAAAHRTGLRRPDPRRAALRRGPRWHRRCPWSAAATRPGGVEPIDPVALPGVESVERQGAPPRTGLAAGDGAAARPRAPRRVHGRRCSPVCPQAAGRRWPTSRRPTTTPCAWWPPGASTTPGAPSPGHRR